MNEYARELTHMYDEKRILDVNINMKNIVAIDLFCGIGGLTHGLELAGINVAAGIDVDETCKYSYERNNRARFIKEDISDVSADKIRDIYPENSIKILVGCAPCQPFSAYSQKYRINGRHDNKWRLLYEFLRIVIVVKPDIISMENVPQLKTENVFYDFVNKIKEIGYDVSWNIINCDEYGVPQSRRRLVLLASKFGNIEMIKPSTSLMTVRDAIGKLPAIRDGEESAQDPLHRSSKLSPLNKQRIRQSKPGGTWLDWSESLLSNCHRKKSGQSYKAVYGRMEWNKPSPTITTQYTNFGSGRFGHPEQDRALSIREGAILQSFPITYVFERPNEKGKNGDLCRHIGNAVPVELGRAIGRSILNHLQNRV